MKLWKLAARLAWFTLRGRGRWDVYLYLEHDPDDGSDVARVMGHADWVLADWSWAGGGDRFVILTANPENNCGPDRTCRPEPAEARRAP